VHQVGYLQGLYRDARSAKRKTLYNVVRNRPHIVIFTTLLQIIQVKLWGGNMTYWRRILTHFLVTVFWETCLW